LVIHADDDDQVLPVEGVGLASDWPQSVRWTAPDGSGHLRILRNDAVIQRIVDFVISPRPVSAGT
jgi:hypothetical protein